MVVIPFILALFQAIQFTMAIPTVNYGHKITPKLMLVAMFEPEEKVWTSNINFKHNFTIPGLSPIHPMVHCVEDYSVCQFTTGEGEINAANSMMAILLNPQFDFSTSYWLLTGIGGGEPTQVTTGSITFAKYAIQVGLQYQIDTKEVQEFHPEWQVGYFGYGADGPLGYPDAVYGTEVFELNEKLRDRAVELAKQYEQDLVIGTEQNIELRKLYPSPGNQNPTIKGCDVLTSDNYWIGNVLGDYFIDFSNMITNGTATYCSAAQEDNATLESMIRLAKYGMVQFDRIIVMRGISNFVRAPPGINDAFDFFQNYPKGGIDHSLHNMFVAGYPIIRDILDNWDTIYRTGETLKPENYIGDIYGTLGGKPNFGKDKYTVR